MRKTRISTLFLKIVFTLGVILLGTSKQSFAYEDKLYFNSSSSRENLRSIYPESLVDLDTVILNTDAGVNEGSKRKVMYLTAGIHGNEVEALIFLWWLEKRFKNGDGVLAKVLRNRDISIVFNRGVNKFGVASKSRYNENGVDLNRNFSLGWRQTDRSGKHALSEQESIALLKDVKSKEPFFAVDIHGNHNTIFLSSAAGVGLKMAYREKLFSFVRNMSKFLPFKKDIVDSFSQGHFGTYEDEMFWLHSIPTISLEIDTDVIPLPLNDFYSAEKIFKKYEEFITATAIWVLKMGEPNRELSPILEERRIPNLNAH